MNSYAQPETLVDATWLVANLEAPNQRIIEVDVDVYSYEEGHIPGAIGWNWSEQLCDQLRRDILSQEAFERLMSSAGINNDTTVILYGDNNNWFAAWAFWQMKIYGHKDVRILNGGRRKWLELDLPLTTDFPTVPTTSYKAQPADLALRPRAAEQLGADRGDGRGAEQGAEAADPGRGAARRARAGEAPGEGAGGEAQGPLTEPEHHRGAEQREQHQRAEPEPLARGLEAQGRQQRPVGAVEEAQAQHIQRTLQRTHGRIYGPGGAAELLAVKPSTLQSKMKKLGIPRA